MEEKYAPVEKEVPGMGEPNAPKGGIGNKKMAIFMIVGAVCLVAAAAGYFLFTSGFFKKPAPVQTPTVQTSESELKAWLEERRELESRIRQLEEERSTLEKKIPEILAQKVEPLQRQIEQLQNTQRDFVALQQQLQSISQSLTSMTAKEEEPEEPAEGSKGETTLFSTVGEYKQRLIEESKVEIPKPKFVKAPGVQIGNFINGKLLTTLISSTVLEDFYAVVESTESMTLDRGLVLPAGVRFLGKVLPDFESRRIIVKIEKMQYGDVEMPISGIVLDERGNPGLVTKYIDPLNQAMWGSLLPNIIAAAADAAQDMVDYYDRDYDIQRERPDFSTKNVALQGASDALRMQSSIMLEMQSRKKPVIIVNKGIPVQIQITGRIPLEILIESGIVQ